MFKIINNSRSAVPTELGEKVYTSVGHDYGCASQDTRYTGVEHVSVTRDPASKYPFFTIPMKDLEKL